MPPGDEVRLRHILGNTLKYVDGLIDVDTSALDLGDQGEPGEPGVGVPAGGSTGQVLTKQSGANYDTDWETPADADPLPAGGSTGQVLTKQSGTDGDADWDTPTSSLPAGGSTGQVLTKQSGTDGDADWETPGVGAVSSVHGRTGAVVAVNGDYTATNVGLGSVTNDAQLKRAANDFSSFASKPVPTGADVIIIEDSAASGAKKHTTIDGISAYLSPDLYLVPPVTPNAFDDEFSGGSPDLAVRGWTFRNHNTATIMTRVGDVYPYETFWKNGVGDLGPNEYRSRIQNGRLVLQLCTDSPNSYFLYKAVSLPHASAPEGGVIWSRFSSSRSHANSGQDVGMSSIFFARNAGGIVDDQNINYHEIKHNTGATCVTTVSQVGRVGGVTTNNSITFNGACPTDIIGLLTTNASGNLYFRCDSVTGETAGNPFFVVPGYQNANAIAYAGMNFFVGQVPEANVSALRYIDFLRLRTGNMQDLCSTGQWIYP